MTFTSAGRLLAKLLILLAVARIGLAVYAINATDAGSDMMRYLGPGSTGQIIDEAIYVLIFAICLGVLTDISRAVQRQLDALIYEDDE
jgi:hypothetical protein